MDKFRGTGVAIVTPFKEDLSVDYSALSNLVEYIIKNGVDYIVALGTTGESVTLSSEEKKRVVDFMIEKNSGRVPVIVGIGGNNTASVVDNIRAYEDYGIDAILSVSPYYNKPTQEGIYQHYKLLSNTTGLPIILYNVPGRTSSNITASTTLSLARECKNIIGIKEASGNMEQIMQIIQNKPDDFLVISGDDALTLPILSCGGDGVISVVANAFPKVFSDMVRSALDMDLARARQLHYQVLDVIHYLFVDGNPAGVKTVLEKLEITGRAVRLPLVEVSTETEEKLSEFLSKYQESKVYN